jgi:hypothetical protein
MLTIFGDESHDEKKQEVFAVVGIAAPQEVWDKLSPIWLERLNGRVFHAADCESNRGDFKNYSHEENLTLYKDLTNILASSDYNCVGFGSAIDIRMFKLYFPNSDIAICYHLNFLFVIAQFAAIACEMPPHTAQFIFDSNQETQSNAGLLFDQISKLQGIDIDKLKDCIGDVSFNYKPKKTGVQCADLFAREVMKNINNRYYKPRWNFLCANQPCSPRTRRKSWDALYNTGRFTYMDIGIEILSTLRSTYADIDATKFAEWLNKTGVVDNISNRIKYIDIWEKDHQR